jgi:Protein of unknown function (DUF2934)
MSFFSLISILISLAAVSSYINYRYIKLPTTVGVMLVALVASLSLVLIGPYAGGFREQAAALVSQIAKRAYDLYEQHGHQGGHAVEDWLQAEREIRKD